MDQLRRAIQNDTKPEISGNVALSTVALCEPAYRDAATGKALAPQAMLHEMVGR
jgi:predicted dehydrogenase